MSAPVPRDKTKLDQQFGRIKVPCLHMTGTRDDSPIGETKAKERRLPFDHITAADQYLVIFTGGDHMIFSGRGRLSGGGKDSVFQDLIRPATTAFWDAYLKDAKPAKAFLTTGACRSCWARKGRWKRRPKRRRAAEDENKQRGEAWPSGPGTRRRISRGRRVLRAAAGLRRSGTPPPTETVPMRQRHFTRAHHDRPQANDARSATHGRSCLRPDSQPRPARHRHRDREEQGPRAVPRTLP